MTEQSTKSLRLPVIVAVLLGVVGTSLGIYQFVKGKNLAQEIANVKSAVNEIKDKDKKVVTFKNKTEFEAAVAESINKFVSQKQQAEIDQKFAQFEAVPEKVEDGKHLYGEIGARFTLVEFSDLECRFCKEFHDTPKQIVDASKGNVNWQWKHMPLDFHNPAAHKEALASECIAEQKGNRGFWVFVNDIFHHSQGNGRGVDDLASLVTGVGAHLDEFRKCLASGKYEEKVEADIQKAKSYGVNGTPATFVVDNQTGKSQLLGGAQTAQAIMAVMRKMIIESQQDDSANQ
ncbi:MULTISPECIES: DsbA family protein [Candidatus Williamhamiltonella]|uniref:Protein-disulfide isomerase n=1 Tax=Candidatus Williamhamiltonella defendens TaxID=138072 RepID=A0A2D3TGE4_9ENTR|nr:DsbA family protein [Candidatus Hamiltonella defensa]ATW34793.1 protein-disulfide isomerase [Candidatus Hamiltonella defensa]AYB49933.1 protein-disulfide isomerase [Candidatus Hamiltonella defensa]